MKISIIITTFNSAENIRKSLTSILNQTYENIEIVIVDGASTDGTLSVVKQFISTKDILISEPDSGIYNAMNKGIRAATGDFIFFMGDSDTFCENSVLATVAEHIISENLDALIGNVRVVGESGNYRFTVTNEDWSPEYLLRESLSHQAFFCRKSLFESHGYFDESLRVTADFDQMVGVLLDQNLKRKYIDLDIANFTLGGISTTDEKQNLRRKEFSSVRKRHFSLLTRVLLSSRSIIIKKRAKSIISSIYLPTLKIIVLFLGKLTLLFFPKPAKEKSILLIGEYNFTGGTHIYFKQLIQLCHNNSVPFHVLLEDTEQQKSMIPYIEAMGGNYSFLSPLHSILKIFKYIPPVKALLFHLMNIYRVSKHFQFSDIIVSVGTVGNHVELLTLPYPVYYILHTYPTYPYHPYVKWSFNAFLNQNKRIITVSQYSKQQITEFVVHPKKEHFVHVIYNGSKDIDISKKKLNPERISILTVGHVACYKNPETWLKVARTLTQKYSQLEFTWVGDGPLYKQYAQETKDLVRVNFVGRSHRINSFMSKANIYFHPSKMESFGLVVIEAMKWKVPPIVSYVGGMKEIIIDEESGIFFDLEKPDDILEKLDRLIQNEHLQKHLGIAARERFLGFFEISIWEDIMKQELNLSN